MSKAACRTAAIWAVHEIGEARGECVDPVREAVEPVEGAGIRARRGRRRQRLETPVPVDVETVVGKADRLRLFRFSGLAGDILDGLVVDHAVPRSDGIAGPGLRGRRQRMLEAGRQRRGVILVGLDVRPARGEHGFGAVGRGMPDDLRVNGQGDEVLDVTVFVVVDVTLGWGTLTEYRVLVVDMPEKIWLRSELTPVRTVVRAVVAHQRHDLGTVVRRPRVPRVTRERL